MQSTTGSLTIVNAHTAAPEAYWSGRKLPLLEIMCHSPKGDDATVKLKVDETVTGFDVEYAAMIAAGIKIKKGS